ncbi:helix-turn-helix domain-containing protein [Roseinatronobacter monicus]|uniref:Cytoskeletal protein RodZ n=1 Tax=Roseinatronobacter monicus TaxID=393481 RepID=A0A543KIC4_9RHOB|nr:helix-turn-helix domain-containing protein [Roseinatronobacter monicus]TQM94829.1 cytoskeletal protein RodZ [Roseinatronobacter monicus]
MKWFGTKPTSEDVDTSNSAAIGFDDFEVRLGDLMRGERATLGKSLLDVQRELHIRATYIAAIESGDLSAFEAASFVAGYVRSYARYLGMDPDWSYAKFCAETGFAISPDLQRSTSSTPRISSQAANRDFSQGLLSRTKMASEPDPFWQRLDPVALGSITVMILLIVGLGFGGWTVLREVQRVNLAPADQSPTVLSDLDPISSGAAPRMANSEEPALRISAPENVSTANAQGVVRNYRPEALETPVVVSRDGPIAAINPREIDIESEDTGFRSAIDLALAEAESGRLSSEDVRVTRDGPPEVEVLAVRPSWIRVRAADGTVLFEKVLDAGERFKVPQSESPATLRAGNSGSVYMIVDGQPFGPTAPGAQVVDQIALSPESVTERFTLADLSDDQALREFVNVAEVEN